jgi:uncharacterized protein GlcG (DUF336 family)
MAESPAAAPSPLLPPLAGGIPLVASGAIVGAVGVSAALADEDTLCAEAGAAALPGGGV